MTHVGVLLGTAAYMSPEVARGRPADKRSDIWAFGCVLYEMLAGTRAFDGNDITEMLGAVVRLEPDWHTLPSTVPSPVVTVLKRSLQKNPNLRLRDIAEIWFQLEDASPYRFHRFNRPLAASHAPDTRAGLSPRSRRLRGSPSSNPLVGRLLKRRKRACSL